MKRILQIIIVLTVIGIVSGGILSLVYKWAEPKIELNLIRETDAAIFKVLPETKRYEKIVKGDLVYFECFDGKGSRIGTAIVCAGNGYQGVIKLMVGVNADFRRFTGMTILEQVETPGLGAKIAGPKFMARFNGLATRPPIEYVKNRLPEKPNEIEAIAGATISSRAVVNIINRTVEQWLRVK